MSEIEINTIYADDVVASEVTFYGIASLRSATGSAKRHPDDEDDAGIGETLAAARALKKLAAELEKDARKAVAKADDKRRKAKAAEEKAAREKAEVQAAVNKSSMVASVNYITSTYPPLAAESAYGPWNPCGMTFCPICKPSRGL